MRAVSMTTRFTNSGESFFGELPALGTGKTAAVQHAANPFQHFDTLDVEQLRYREPGERITAHAVVADLVWRKPRASPRNRRRSSEAVDL